MECGGKPPHSIRNATATNGRFPLMRNLGLFTMLDYGTTDYGTLDFPEAKL